MEIAISTPALLFPALSLLMLAYTNRFLALASLIRSLHALYKESREARIAGQIKNLRERVNLIRNMQSMGIISLFFCVLSMFEILFGIQWSAAILFIFSLLFMALSLILAFIEVQKSTSALNLALSDLEHSEQEQSHEDLPAL